MHNVSALSTLLTTIVQYLDTFPSVGDFQKVKVILLEGHSITYKNIILTYKGLHRHHMTSNICVLREGCGVLEDQSATFHKTAFQD